MRTFCGIPVVLCLVAILDTTLIQSHHQHGGARHHNGAHHVNGKHKSHHNESSTHHSQVTQNPFEKTIEEAEEEESLSANGQGGGAMVSEVKPKVINLGFWRPSKPEKLLVFNIERYGNWSDWSECLVKDCIEVRHRKCLDDSWMRPSPNKIHTTKCLSKYYAEKRACQNKSMCNSQIGAEIIEKLSDTCGVRPNKTRTAMKILGGVAAVPHSWPWAVRLSVHPPRQDPVTFCGGTMIAPQWIMTAAHCLLVENKRMPVGRLVNLADHMKSRIYVHLGDHDKQESEESQQDYLVTKAILHPKYHRKMMTDGDDIALLYLAEPAKMTSQVGHICLPSKEQLRLEPGTKCFAVGWGHSKSTSAPTFDDVQSILDSLFMPFPSLFDTPIMFGHSFRPWAYRRGRGRWGRRGNRRNRQDEQQQQAQKKEDSTTIELHEVELPVVGMSECSKHYTNLNEEVHICAGSKGKDTCSGDSGGGLYCRLPKSGNWFVAGVTSFGLARGCGHNPGVYTSVAAHLDWVSKTMAQPAY